jgi:3-oxoacyl-[acyl-carrier protein] reductase
LLGNKVAVITGSSRGIGFAIAKEFAQNGGATVIMCSRSIKQSEKAAQDIGKNAHAMRLDISSSSSVRAFIANVMSRFNRIDILVNNAGYHFDRKIWYKPFHEVTDKEMSAIIDVDLKGSIRLSRAVIPAMIKNGGGIVISISSTPAISGHTEGAAYSIAKAGLIAMTKHIALEYGSKNIRAYTLALGNIRTEATFDSMNDAQKKAAEQENAMKRWGEPDEVARIAANIASDSFSFATGNTIVVDGGSVFL